MSKTVKIEAAIPLGFHKAAQLVCDTFKVSLDEFVTNAIRGELQCCAHNNCEDYAQTQFEQLARVLKEVAGEDL